MSTGAVRLGCFIPQGWRIDFPQSQGPGERWEAAITVARRAEHSGYGALWVYDHLQAPEAEPPSPVFDPLLLLATVAWVTSAIRIGTMCLAVPLHHPGRLAQQLACLDVASGGRLEVGLGAGSDPGEARAFGIAVPGLRERILACGEAAELLRASWNHEHTSFEGRYTVVEDALIYPKPIQRPGPPIWIAGGGEKLTLWQVARHADGCSLFGPPARFARKLEVLAAHCRAAGRRPETVRAAVVVDCLVADTEAAADLLVERFNRHGEDRSSYRARRLVGTPQGCAQQLQEYIDLGAREICCYFPDVVSSDGLEQLATAVLGPTPPPLARGPGR
ncbi:MAG TPA: LLM class flavin-dependent oxidoreductase [Candidatus Dormibacteraeota bacterium]|nr:LLM class flavin-dependent oxidoreductase [Candidatus Dormibacteraeota bacterium]